jgi:hypothetical protein
MTRSRSRAISLADDLLRRGFARFNIDWRDLARIYPQVVLRRWSRYALAVLLPLDLASTVMRYLAGWRTFQAYVGLGLAVWVGAALTVTILEYRRYQREPREPEAIGQDSILERGDDLAALDDIPGDVVSLVAAGKKIQAIKRYREVTGVGLKEAKTIVDGLRRRPSGGAR